MIKALKQFIRNEDGNVLVMTAGMAIPVLALAGGAIEYTEIYRAKSNMQSAADRAVVAAFYNSRESWTQRQKRTTGFFKANLNSKARFDNLRTKLTYRHKGEATVMTFTATASMKSMFGELSPLSDPNFSIQATAEYNPESRRAPYLIENSQVIETVKQDRSRRKR